MLVKILSISLSSKSILLCCFSIYMYELITHMFYFPGLSVAVSLPNISNQSKPILGQLFYIVCRSDVGSLPITYILYNHSTKLDTRVIRLPNQTALFPVVISSAKEQGRYKCEAQNGGRRIQSTELVINAIGTIFSSVFLFNVKFESNLCW